MASRLQRAAGLILTGLAGLGLLACSAPAARRSDPPAALELPGAWEADVRAKLIELIETHGRGGPKHDPAAAPVVVFDFDNTTIHGDIGRAFFDWMTLHQKFRFDEALWQALPDERRDDIRAAWQALQALPAEARAGAVELQEFRKRMHQVYWGLCQESDPERCYPWQVRYYAGWTPDEVRAMAGEVFAFELGRPLGSEPIRAGADDPAPAITSTGLRFHGEIRELMRALEARGFELWIVTAGPQWVVQAAADHLPVPPGRIIGMRTRLLDGKLTTEMEPPPTFRQGKVDAIEQFIGRRPVLAIGDAWTDAEMLAHAEHAVLIDRGYADLRKRAFESGWWVQPTFPVE